MTTTWNSFLERVRKTNTCWIWTGRKTDSGYGLIGFNRKSNSLAHKVMWEHVNGPIPKGLQVLHNCPDGDNPSCVNPDHLWLGTMDDNMKDMRKKGRASGQNQRVQVLIEVLKIVKGLATLT